MRRFNIDAAPELIRAARRDAGLTQTQLAERAGLHQPSLAQMESGRRSVSDEMLERVLRAADYRPSIPLAMHADEISASARAHGLSNPRVFGSALRGEDTFDSDIDLLVTPAPGTDLFDLALFAAEVEELTGFPVEAVADTSVPDALKSAVREAVPL
ncbi:helix-turn-helix domain-containing protein [Actinomyces procaprae]|uniref:helix-turn-helix domain-containing protein n=1 Tax=Actinomyces procaprae TaxID=2560010 RepID=UPI0010A290C7|nr:XRE family transcriptional regulator [Actinomyces procaprae]